MRVLLFLLALATPAFAQSTEMGVGSHVRSLRSTSANAITDENLPAFSFSLGRQLYLDLVTDLEIWVTAGYQRGGATGSLFDMATDLDVHQILVGGGARYRLHRHVIPWLRLDTGLARTSLALEDDGRYLSDAAWGGLLNTALGIDLLAVAKPNVSLGLRAEFGYTAATDVELAPAQMAREGMIELPASQASLGRLDLAGRYFGFSLLAQF